MPILAFDIGGTRVTAALGTKEGEILALERRASPRPEGAEGVRRAMETMAQELLHREGREVEAIGIGFGGPVDAAQGIVLRSHHVAGWEGFPLGAWAQERWGAPAWVENDANAGALGEWFFGAGRGCQHLVYLNLGTGIGGGVILQGRLLRGAHSIAGEVGHMTVWPNGPLCPCGRRGCLEAVCSGDSIARRARARLALEAQVEPSRTSLLETWSQGRWERVRSEQVFEAARQGDPLAQEVVEETLEYLALGIANLLVLFDPERVILGGGVAEAGEVLWEPLRRRVEEKAHPLYRKGMEVLPARLGYDAGILGALALVRYEEELQATQR